jgi:hypothetical protein
MILEPMAKMHNGNRVSLYELRTQSPGGRGGVTPQDEAQVFLEPLISLWSLGPLEAR